MLLIGGFASSTSLRHVLRKELDRLKCGIRLIRPMEASQCETAISAGAVYRALNKQNGPVRESLSSYGFLQDEEFDPALDAHKGKKVIFDPLDKKEYIDRCINWLIKKVCYISTTRQKHILNNKVRATKFPHSKNIACKCVIRSLLTKSVSYARNCYTSPTRTMNLTTVLTTQLIKVGSYDILLFK